MKKIILLMLACVPIFAWAQTASVTCGDPALTFINSISQTVDDGGNCADCDDITVTFSIDFTADFVGTDWLHGVFIEPAGGWHGLSATGLPAGWEALAGPVFGACGTGGTCVSYPGGEGFYYTEGDGDPANFGASSGPINFAVDFTLDICGCDTPGGVLPNIVLALTDDGHTGSYTGCGPGAQITIVPTAVAAADVCCPDATYTAPPASLYCNSPAADLAPLNAIFDGYTPGAPGNPWSGAAAACVSASAACGAAETATLDPCSCAILACGAVDLTHTVGYDADCNSSQTENFNYYSPKIDPAYVLPTDICPGDAVTTPDAVRCDDAAWDGPAVTVALFEDAACTVALDLTAPMGCAAITKTVYAHIDSGCPACDSCTSLGTINIHPEPASITTDDAGTCAAAGFVEIQAADGTVCFSQAGPAPSGSCTSVPGTEENLDNVYSYTHNAGQACEQIFSATTAGTCLLPDCCNAVPGTVTGDAMYFCNSSDDAASIIKQLTVTTNNDFSYTNICDPGGANTPGVRYLVYASPGPTAGSTTGAAYCNDPNYTGGILGSGPLNDPGTWIQGSNFGDVGCGINFGGIGATPGTTVPNLGYNTVWMICPQVVLDEATSLTSQTCPESTCEAEVGTDCIEAVFFEPMVIDATKTCGPEPWEGTVTFTVTGGYPAYAGDPLALGTDYTFTNTGGNGTLDVTAAASGTTVTLSGLVDGGYTIEVADPYGCIKLLSGVWNQPTMTLDACSTKECQYANTDISAACPANNVLAGCITGMITPQLGEICVDFTGDSFTGGDGSGFEIYNSAGVQVFANVGADGVFCTGGLSPFDTYEILFVDAFGDGFSCAGTAPITVTDAGDGAVLATFAADFFVHPTNPCGGTGVNSIGPFPLIPNAAAPTGFNLLPSVTPIGTLSGTGVIDNLDNTADFDATAAGPGVHTVTYDYTDSQGCVLQRTVDITVCANPAAPVAANVCEGFAITPDAQADATDFLYWDGATAPTMLDDGSQAAMGASYTPAAGAGTYWVVAVNTDAASGVSCYSCPVAVTVYPTPPAPVAVPDIVCDGLTGSLDVTVDVATCATVEWFSDMAGTTSVFVGTPYVPADTTPGDYTYYAQCTSADGCKSLITPVTLTIVEDIVIANPTPDCSNYYAVAVDVSGGLPDHAGTLADPLAAYTFTMTNNPNPATFAPTPAENGATYSFTGLTVFGTETLTVTDATGCDTQVSVNVYEDIVPVIDSPNCGEIDMVSIRGGWDPNNAAFTDSPVGYTVTITGPNNSALAPAASYSFGPTAVLTGTEFIAGSNGVPANGLPGGSYTVTIEDGKNADCIPSFNIDVLGCCPASTDASGDYQLCGMISPASSGGSQIFGDLPDLSSAITGLVVDANTTLTLNTQDAGSGQDAGGDGIDWFQGPDPLVDAPYSDADMKAADNCTEGTFTLYAFLRCDGDHDGAFAPAATGTNTGVPVGYDPAGADTYIPAGSVTVTVWPEFAAEIQHPAEDVASGLECRVEIIPSCADETVLGIQFEATVDDVAFGPGVVTFPAVDGAQVVFTGTSYIIDPDAVWAPAASIGNVSATMTAVNAPTDIRETCVEIPIGPEDYRCCIAEAGMVEGHDICPPPSLSPDTPGSDLTVTITDYEDFNLYDTHLVVTDANGVIIDVIDLTAAAPANVTYTPSSNAAGIPSIPTGGTTTFEATFAYDYWDALIGIPDCTTGASGLDVSIYSYSDFNILTDGGVQLSPADYLGQPIENLQMDVSSTADTNIICADISPGIDVFIPSPFEFDCGGTNSWEGEQGNILPFYYNYHQGTICGGSRPYTYEWDRTGYVRWDIEHGPVGDVINIYYADAAEWSYTVTDSNGCTMDPGLHCTNDSNGDVNQIGTMLDIESVVIKGESYSSYTAGGQTGDGSITIEMTGCSDGGYLYNWSGPGGYSSTVQSPAGLESGHYEVTVTCPADGETTEGYYWVPLDRRSGRLKTGELVDIEVEAYPNPMQDFTTLQFALPTDSEVVLEIFATDGSLVSSNNLGRMYGGKVHEYILSSKDMGLSTGTYLVKISSDTGKSTSLQLVIVQ